MLADFTEPGEQAGAANVPDWSASRPVPFHTQTKVCVIHSKIQSSH